MTADFINSLAWFLVGYPATQKTLGRKVTLIHLLCFHGMLLRYINYSWSLVPFKVLLVCFFCAPSILVSLLLFRSLMCRFELERFTLKGWKMRKRTALVDLLLEKQCRAHRFNNSHRCRFIHVSTTLRIVRKRKKKSMLCERMSASSLCINKAKEWPKNMSGQRKQNTNKNVPPLFLYCVIYKQLEPKNL